MRTTLLFAVVLSCCACHKDDVDVAAMNSNTFDADHPTNDVFEVGTITTATLVGSIRQQRIPVEVHPERFPVPTDPYELWLVETAPEPDTVVDGTHWNPGPSFILKNQQVVLGTEYHYRIELHVRGEMVRSEERVSVAEL